MLGIALLLLGVMNEPARAGQSQEKQHVVSLEELNRDAARPAQARESNETAVRELFSSSDAQNALRSANVDYKKVDQAIGQLSDADLAKIAERSRQTQSEFAAGRINRQGWIVILVAAAVLIIVLAIVF
jgi:hypothetical protein